MERRLAAILAADVVDYSRLMGEDQARTLDALRQLRSELFEPVVDEHKGTVVKRMGDGWIVEFPSVSDAVDCAMRIQDGLAAHEIIRLRTGIHIGDVVFESEDVFGEGVNVAARLEEQANPGEVLISDTAHQSLDGKAAAQFSDGNVHQLKNIARPVQVWRWSVDSGTDGVSKGASKDAPLVLPDKPSIAVLPFDNMSGDPEQEYFSDGIAEDVITALSRFRSLFVIARNSSFTYKGQAVDIKQVAGELGVRYVVEGSVRKAGNRVRITAQLIEAASGNHLWADRFDGTLDDVFDLQDQITEQIVVAAEPEIGARERERARRKPPDNLDAWELLQRGLSYFYRYTKTGHDKAMQLFKEAAELDPDFAAAHAYLAYTLANSTVMGFVEDWAIIEAPTRVAAEQAIFLDPTDPIAHCALGRVNLNSGDVEMAIDEMQTAIACNPNHSWGHYGLALAYVYGAAKWEDALPHFDSALRLSPRDPLRWATLFMKGSALRLLGRYEEAIAVCRQACQFPAAGYLPYMHLAASLAEAERMDEAQAAVEKIMELVPAFSISFIREHFPGLNETNLRVLAGSLRKAGVPE